MEDDDVEPFYPAQLTAKVFDADRLTRSDCWQHGTRTLNHYVFVSSGAATDTANGNHDHQRNAASNPKSTINGLHSVFYRLDHCGLLAERLLINIVTPFRRSVGTDIDLVEAWWSWAGFSWLGIGNLRNRFSAS